MQFTSFVLLTAVVSCQSGSDLLYAETRSDSRSTEKVFDQPKELQYSPRFLTHEEPKEKVEIYEEEYPMYPDMSEEEM